MAGRLELVYGKSQSGKSTWAIQLAEHFYVKKGLRTRVYIGDGGTETYESSGLVDEGIIELVQYNLRDHPFATLQLMCEGYWPEDPNDPKSVLLAPNWDILPSAYGLFVYEGLSVAADYMMGDKEGGLSFRAAKGEKIGQDSPFVVTEKADKGDGKSQIDLKFGGNPPSHFGFVQRRIVDLIERTRGIPLPFVLWTAHERKSEDYDTRESEFGPDIAGKALTTKIGAYFGNTIHLHGASKRVKRKDPVTMKDVEGLEVEKRAYTKTHYDPDGQTTVKFFANNRMPREFAKDMPEYLTPPDPVRFYSILEDAKRKKQKLLQERRMEEQAKIQQGQQ